MIEVSQVPEPEPKISKNLPLDHVAEDHQGRSVNNFVGEKSEEKTLHNFIPKSESDFSEYAQLISQKLHLYKNSFHYIELLKVVTKLSITALKAGDAKEIASSVAAIANEKLKSEKEAKVGKLKIGAKKKQLNVDKANEDVIVEAYDSYDDYDFK